ncbi:MAG: hypothetical protein WDN02_11030 [Methylovirgula sp.]|uniref:plasmid mobilization protein n=1 Tax=Methylovirgula sp. TaxID=1978224 RepID=UPI0030760CD9
MAAEASGTRSRRSMPWRGRKRVNDARTRFIAVRCTAEEHAAIDAAATAAGLSIGAYLRAQALGDPGPRSVRRPPVERKELARLIGLLGKLGSNVNQIAHAFNSARLLPGFPELVAIRRDIAEMRAALIKALGRGD